MGLLTLLSNIKEDCKVKPNLFTVEDSQIASDIFKSLKDNVKDRVSITWRIGSKLIKLQCSTGYSCEIRPFGDSVQFKDCQSELFESNSVDAIDRMRSELIKKISSSESPPTLF